VAVAAEARRVQAEKLENERKKAAEQKKREMESSMEARRQQAEQIKQEADRKRKEAAKRATAAAEAQRQRQNELKAAADAKRLEEEKKKAEAAPKSRLARAPRGVPTIIGWKQRKDGKIFSCFFEILPQLLR